jgi:hypothetical protein
VVRKNSMLPSLAVISTGAENDAAVEKLQSEQMSTLVAYLRKKARFTIIHAPSTSLGADAQAIANLADAALLVVETPRTRYDQIRDGIRQVHRMGAAVLGAVVLPEQTESSVGTAEPPTLTRMSVEESDKHVMGGSQSPRQVGNGAPSGDRKVADGSGGGSVPAQVAAQEDQTGHQIPWS